MKRFRLFNAINNLAEKSFFGYGKEKKKNHILDSRKQETEKLRVYLCRWRRNRKYLFQGQLLDIMDLIMKRFSRKQQQLLGATFYHPFVQNGKLQHIWRKI